MAKDEIALTMRIISVKKETNDAPPFLRAVDSQHKYFKDYPGHIQRCYSITTACRITSSTSTMVNSDKTTTGILQLT